MKQLIFGLIFCFLSSIPVGRAEHFEALPTTESEEEDVTPVTLEGERESPQKTGRIWKSPDYANQPNALGYGFETFHQAPFGMEKRVDFWVDIYTKYSTRQGLLHDSRYLDIIYKVIDFADIDARTDINGHQKESLKRKRVKEEKAIVKESLLKIEKMGDNFESLSDGEKELRQKFRFVLEKKKYWSAAQRGRLRFQLGQSDQFKLGIFYSGRFLPLMEKIFRDEGLPVELTRLPFVESSFNIYARSHVGASGIWQFMRSTGKLFKLKIDNTIDQRNDPILATHAAARLLKFNYGMLGSWGLALTAYNHGPAGVARIKRKLQTDDLNEIVWNSEARRFGFASENFFAEFLAAVRVEKFADKYFGKIEISPILEFDEIEVPRPLPFPAISVFFGGEEERAKMYNPFFTRYVWSGRRLLPSGLHIRVPKGTSVDWSKVTFSGSSTRAKSGIEESTMTFYKVQRGDTLSSIGRDFGISPEDLMKFNSVEKASELRVGQTLKIPGNK